MDTPFIAKSIDLKVRGKVTGTVNGSAIEGSVAASINTGRGGLASCEFTQLPKGFTPATIAPYA